MSFCLPTLRVVLLILCFSQFSYATTQLPISRVYNAFPGSNSKSFFPIQADWPTSEFVKNHVYYYGLHESVFNPWKRGMDIIGSLVGLGILAALYIPIAIAIKLDSPGPIFFTQVRVGLEGKTFIIWKLRSMVTNAEEFSKKLRSRKEEFFKDQNDPRITRVGRFLRKTSLDEFPQFWNVLKGEMSLVGTRPSTIIEYLDMTEFHKLRYRVIPGITGQWQVFGRGEVKDVDDVVKMDLAYQRKWSLSYDIELILRTLGKVFSLEGAH